MQTTTVTQKGQVTIPVHIRRKLGVKPSQKLVFEERKNVVIVRPVVDFFSLRGSLKTSKPYDEKRIEKAVGEFLAKRYRDKNTRR